MPLNNGNVTQISGGIYSIKHERLQNHAVRNLFDCNKAKGILTYDLEVYGNNKGILHTYVGKENINYALKIINLIKPNEVINIGISGALKENLKEGDLIIPNYLMNNGKKLN